MPLRVDEIIKQAQQLDDLDAAGQYVQQQLMELSNYIMHRVVTKTKQRIMLVDDSDFDHTVLGNWLVKAGYEVLDAYTGDMALEMLQHPPKPDIILLDIYMPGMSGYDVCPQIKDIPVIFCTSCTGIFDEAKGLKLGAVDYIKKPYTKDIILARIKTHIKR